MGFLDKIGAFLQQLSQALITGPIPLSLTTIAIVLGALGIYFGHISWRTFAGIIVGAALWGGAATAAQLLVGG